MIGKDLKNISNCRKTLNKKKTSHIDLYERFIVLTILKKYSYNRVEVIQIEKPHIVTVIKINTQLEYIS